MSSEGDMRGNPTDEFGVEKTEVETIKIMQGYRLGVVRVRLTACWLIVLDMS
jgi:hypothetical protein